MITDRDYKVIEFVTKLPCYSNTIQKLFFSNTSQIVANRRLAVINDYLYLQRFRHGASDRYFYYAGRMPSKKSHRHYDYIARAYWWVQQNGYIVKDFEVQKQYGNVRPDLLLKLEDKKGNKGNLAVEIELSNNNVCGKIKKYEQSEFKKLLLFSDMDATSNRLDIIAKRLEELE